MIIKKKAGTFDVYVCELSFKELQAFQAAGREAGDPVADEASKAIQWYFANEVPPPGVDEHPSKVKDGMGDDADAILPSAGGLPDMGDPGAPVGGDVPGDEAPKFPSVGGEAGDEAPDEEARVSIETEIPTKEAPEGEDESEELDKLLPEA